MWLLTNVLVHPETRGCIIPCPEDKNWHGQARTSCDYQHQLYRSRLNKTIIMIIDHHDHHDHHLIQYHQQHYHYHHDTDTAKSGPPVITNTNCTGHHQDYRDHRFDRHHHIFLIILIIITNTKFCTGHPQLIITIILILNIVVTIISIKQWSPWIRWIISNSSHHQHQLYRSPAKYMISNWLSRWWWHPTRVAKACNHSWTGQLLCDLLQVRSGLLWK